MKKTRTRVGQAALALVASGTLAISALALTQTTAQAVDPASPSTHTLEFTGESGGGLGYISSRVSCDVNGDGIDDTIVGDPDWDRPGFTNVGAGYVVLGSKNAVGGDVADPSTGVVRIDGPQIQVAGGAWLGWGVSCLGDVNGDGIDDFVLGSGSTSWQKAAVIFGAKDFSSVDVENLGTAGFYISNPTASINFGYWVGEVGDINHDGYADIGIGDILADNNGRSNSGSVWVISGSESVRNLDVTVDTDRVLLRVDGSAASDRLATVASAGDVNGDHIDDLIVSAYTATPWGTAAPVAGAAYVVYGSTTSGRIVDAGALGNQGFAIYGGTRGRDRLGMSAAPAGDVNGDGLADIIVGGDGVTNAATGNRSGGAAIVFGSTSNATVITEPESTGATVYTCADGSVTSGCTGSTKNTRGYWINGDITGRGAGWAVASVGDINGDGTPDQVIGTTGSTRVWAVYGQATSTATIELASLTDTTGMLIGEGYGRAVGNAGDHDGNGVNDIVMGNSSGNKAAIVLLGALNTTTTLSGPATAQAGDSASLAVTVQADVPSAREALTGSVTVTDNGTALTGCENVAVTAATAELSCDLSGLVAGTHSYQASFTPADTAAYAASTVAHGLTVEALPTGEPSTPGPTAPPTTTAPSPQPIVVAHLVGKTKVSVKSVKAGKRLVAQVRLGRLSNGQWPTGVVRVRYAGKVINAKVSTSQHGVVKVVLAKKAKHTKKARVVTVRYLGNATTTPGKIVTVKAKVTRR
jgi:hypothetical protein